MLNVSGLLFRYTIINSVLYTIAKVSCIAHQTEVAFDGNDNLDRVLEMSKHGHHPRDMPHNDGPHVGMSGDGRVVEADDLAKGSLDMFVLMDRVEKWRRSKDIIYRLFTDPDETELTEHTLGIIAAEGTTKDPGLLQQRYDTQLSMRSWRVLHTLQDEYESTKKRIASRRMQKHFVILVALSIENGFCRYVSERCNNREHLRHFVYTILQPTLADLLRGEMLIPAMMQAQRGGVAVESFVHTMRTAYLSCCYPMPITV